MAKKGLILGLLAGAVALVVWATRTKAEPGTHPKFKTGDFVWQIVRPAGWENVYKIIAVDPAAIRGYTYHPWHVFPPAPPENWWPDADDFTWDIVWTDANFELYRG